MKNLLFVLLLLSGIAFAQEVPAPIIDDAFKYAVVGELQIKVTAYEKWVISLKQVIAQLQQENAELKAKCKDRCEEKK